MKGWHRESYRHSLAARGIRTSFKAVDVPYYDDVAMSLFTPKDLGKRLGFGRDRIVFNIGKDEDQVIKIALNPSGLKQNKMELEDVGLKPLYHGRDFVVIEKAAKTMKDDTDVTDYGIPEDDFRREIRRLAEKYPDAAQGDLSRYSSWGFDKDGNLVILDKGSLDKFSLRITQDDIDKWDADIAARRIELRNQGRGRLIQMVKDKSRIPEAWKGERWGQWEIRPRLTKVRTDPSFLETEREDINKVLKELQERKVREGLTAIAGGAKDERMA